jgi:hypothetical protein
MPVSCDEWHALFARSLHGRSHGWQLEGGSMIGRQFGAIRKLPSGNFQASYIAPGIGRVTAPIREALESYLAS